MVRQELVEVVADTVVVQQLQFLQHQVSVVMVVAEQSLLDIQLKEYQWLRMMDQY